MVLELKQLFEIAGEVQTFKYELDLSGYELFSLHPFRSPVHVTGRVFNTAGVVELDYSVQFSMKLPCDRCTDEFQSDYAFSFRNTLVAQNAADRDEYIEVPDFRLDLDELALSDILLHLPSKFLCSEDCQGLCPKCGANRNRTPCQCSEKEIDPRLAVLGELLK